jgi:16S rRNA (adenine1518-N6/adenine1519-N6)-dimethyltransferase
MRARQRFGQHFLEPAWRTRVAEACQLTADDVVVEIGPGTGALTDLVLARVARVLAIEIDRDLAAALASRAEPRLTVHEGDVLRHAATDAIDAWLGPDPATAWRVVGNLPYNVASPILARLARWREARPGLVDATVMLQAEVADRLVAAPATRDYGVLTLSMAMVADAKQLLDLPPRAFRPAPKVHSALVRLTFRPPPPGVGQPALVDRLIRTAFTQRRKTIVNALRALAGADGLDPAAVVEAAGIDGRRRPETLQLLEFSALADAWQAASVARAVL